MIKLFFGLSALLFVRTIEAQNLSPTVVNASGGSIQNNSYFLEWSLGELAVSTLSSSTKLLTQGFLQPKAPTSGTEDNASISPILAFPNPVSGFLTLQADALDIQTVQVHDMLGRLVMQCGFQPSIDLRQLESGTFVISLLNKQNELLRSFKISKT